MEENEKRAFIAVNPDAEQRRLAILPLVLGAAVVASLFLPLLLRLLEPALNGIKKGVYTDLVLHIVNAVFYALVFTAFYLCFRRRFPLYRRSESSLSIQRRGIVLAVILAAGLIFSAVLEFRLRFVYELGEKFTGTQLAARSVYLLEEALKLVSLVYALALWQEGCERLFLSRFPLPFAGVLLLITYGVAEFFSTVSLVPWIFLPLALLYGIIYILTQKRVRTTYFVCLILFLL